MKPRATAILVVLALSFYCEVGAAEDRLCYKMRDAEAQAKDLRGYQRAVGHVLRLPEFVEWEKRVVQAGRRAAFGPPSGGRVRGGRICMWDVNVYESASSHSARWKTFRFDVQGKVAEVGATPDGDFMSLATWRKQAVKVSQ